MWIINWKTISLHFMHWHNYQFKSTNICEKLMLNSPISQNFLAHKYNLVYNCWSTFMIKDCSILLFQWIVNVCQISIRCPATHEWEVRWCVHTIPCENEHGTRWRGLWQQQAPPLPNSSEISVCRPASQETQSYQILGL